MRDPSTSYDWLAQDILTVAPMLLGWELISHAGGAKTAGRIVEVEAYHGAIDPASHAYRGLTPRTAPMFGRGGGVYVYLSYGIHTCLNLVTGPAGDAQGVLIRALEPTQGLDIMAQRRHLPTPLTTAGLRRLARGPGSLGQALGITLDLSGTLLGGTLKLAPPLPGTPEPAIIAGPRIGLKKAAGNPWRFYIAGNSFVSGK